jgi:two-component system, OmpR family, alkaline phosphatase synthesis response regulator PhoP
MDYSKYKLLIVDDEPDITEFISYNLKNKGYQTFIAHNGKDAIALTRKEHPHLILMDIMMPGIDGIETCENIREMVDIPQPIIAFLTARGEDYSQIAGFEAGGDDYISKPIKPKVLESRIKALLKRIDLLRENMLTTAEAESPNVRLILDRERFVAILEGKEMFFPRKEFELLNLLVSKPDKVFTREEIFHKVWGDDVIVGDRTIDVHIRKLREKIGDEHIKTTKGIGYKYIE